MENLQNIVKDMSEEDKYKLFVYLGETIIETKTHGKDNFFNTRLKEKINQITKNS
jgi:hypothetical protein